MSEQQILHYVINNQADKGMLYKIPSDIYLSENISLPEGHLLDDKQAKGVYFVPCYIDASEDEEPLLFVVNGVNNEMTVTSILTLIQLTVDTYRQLSEEIDAYQHIQWLPAYVYYPDPEVVDFYNQGLFEELVLKLFPLKEGVRYEPVLPLGYLRPLDMRDEIETLTHSVEAMCIMLRNAECEFIEDGVY